MRILFTAALLLSCSIQPSEKKGVRVVSLAPSLTEIVFALNRGDNLVGVTTHCDYPPAAGTKYKVGDFSNQSLERIILTRPDLVLVNLPEQTRIKNELEKLRIKTYNSSPETIEDILLDIRELGRILSAVLRADSLIDSLRRELAATSRAVGSDSPAVYLEISPQPLVTVGGKSYINEAIERAGGRNVFRDLSVDYPVVAQEEIIRRNPDVIFILHDAPTGTRIGWGRVSAVKQKRIYYDIDPDLVFRPGPRIIEGIKQMHQRLSPMSARLHLVL